MARPWPICWAWAVLFLILQADVSWGAAPDKKACEAVSGDQHDVDSSSPATGTQAWPFAPALVESQPDADVEAGHDEAVAGPTELSHFELALPRNSTDAFHDSLYPVSPREPDASVESQSDGEAMEEPSQSSGPSEAESRPCDGLGRRSPDEPSDIDARSLAFLRSSLSGKGHNYEDDEEDRLGRERLYGSRHSLFGTLAAAAIYQLSDSPKKRKRRPSTSSDSDPIPSSEPESAKRPRPSGTQWSSSSQLPAPKLSSSLPRQPEPSSESNPDTILLRMPQTRHISHDELVAEAKGIYAGLVMVENKCIEVNQAAAQSDLGSKLSRDQWQALIALHRTLLHEHRDFFLATQHPSASSALRRLPTKYAMPARMWRHGIHSLLEILRRQLPESVHHMSAFIYIAYHMLALLYETVPAFNNIWIECLGDLARYRMAIEDSSLMDREIWTCVSRYWYARASDRDPTSGRLYHHLAILSRPNCLRQLFFYAKSLCVPTPFPNTRESIMTLFDPILAGASTMRLPSVDRAFVRAHSVLFSGRQLQGSDFPTARDEFLWGLDSHIAESSSRWMQAGTYFAISNICSLMEYGKADSPLALALSNGLSSSTNRRRDDTDMDGDPERLSATSAALELTSRTSEIVLSRVGDDNVLPYLHVQLVFLLYLSRQQADSTQLIADAFPWRLLAAQLNSMVPINMLVERMPDDEPFPASQTDSAPRPLPEDWAMRGLAWAESYFSEDWFEGHSGEYEYDRFRQMTDPIYTNCDRRKDRILWLAWSLAKSGSPWLGYDPETKLFGPRLLYQSGRCGIVAEADLGSEAGPSYAAEEISEWFLSMRDLELPIPDPVEKTPDPVGKKKDQANDVDSAPGRLHCGECGKAFEKRGDLNKHVSSAHTKPYACSHCGWQFGSDKDVQRHVEAKHTANADRKVFKCGHCGKEYGRIDNLKRHQKTHQKNSCSSVKQ